MLKTFRKLICNLIYVKEWTWLEHFINFLCELEMLLRNHPFSHIRKLDWGTEVIPKSIYCYSGAFMCPYLSFSKIAKFFYGTQSTGYCYYIGKGDFNSDTMILWDCCKCCSVNSDINITEEECVE